jgi:site-specific DNA-cytosine methylase
VNHDGAGHVSSFRTVACDTVQDPGAGDKRWNGGTSSRLPAPGVRRLTTVECERLQGWPDDWTQLGNTPDSKRYAACGDGVTAHVAEWIGHQLLAHVRQEAA